MVSRPLSVWRRKPLSLIVGLSVAALCVLAGCGGTSDSREAEALRSYREGIELENQGNLLKAGSAYTFAIDNDPGFADAYARRAYIFYVHGDMQGAFDDLARATELDPNLAVAYHYRGLVYTALEDYEAAMLTFSKAIDLDPELAEAHYNRAMVNLHFEELAAAIDGMSAVIRLEPGAPRYYMERAQLYLMAGDGDRAVADLEQVLSLARDERMTLAAKQLLAEIRRAARP